MPSQLPPCRLAPAPGLPCTRSMARQLLMLLGACLQGDTSYAHAASLQMHAAVAGLGPAFKIKLTLQNTGTSVVRHLPVVRHGGIVKFRIRAHAAPPPHGMSACGSCWKPLSHQPLKQPVSSLPQGAAAC